MIRVRPAGEEDEEFILSLAYRFAQCEIPRWRTAEEIEDGTKRWLKRALSESPRVDCIVVAVDSDGLRLGFLYAHEREDFFTGIRYGHVSEIAVISGAEGRGVAETLMQAAQDWASDRGYRRIGLNVFANNGRARRFYERLGFEPESLSYSKDLLK
ncbi:MAG: GNAT family N-acetyltransferase [Acidobacteriota bacterium]